MAGDIGIEEQILVVPGPSRALHEGAAAKMQEVGMRVIHRYGSRVMIAEAPPHRMERIRAAVPDMEIAATPRALSRNVTEGLDPVGVLGLTAFSLRQSPEYIAAKEQRPYKGEPWDASGPLPPDPPPQFRALAQPRSDLATGVVVGTTGQRMMGSVAEASSSSPVQRLICNSQPTKNLR
jgi:hypothetical protein